MARNARRRRKKLRFLSPAAANAIWLVDAGAWGATREVWAVYCKRRPLGREERALQRVKRAAGAPAHHNSNYSIGVARSAHDLVRWEVPGGRRRS